MEQQEGAELGKISSEIKMVERISQKSVTLENRALATLRCTVVNEKGGQGRGGGGAMVKGSRANG